MFDKFQTATPAVSADERIPGFRRELIRGLPAWLDRIEGVLQNLPITLTCYIEISVVLRSVKTAPVHSGIRARLDAVQAIFDTIQKGDCLAAEPEPEPAPEGEGA